MAEVAEKKGYGLTWEEVCAFPGLDDLPFKIETNEWGQIVMSPTWLKHGFFQAQIALRLEKLLEGGSIITEAGIRTTKGTKVADVAWFSAERWEQVKDDYDATVAAEICVEVLSPGNAPGEIEQKKGLYFEAGADEVWLCQADGTMQFFDAKGALNASKRAPTFPNKMEM